MIIPILGTNDFHGGIFPNKYADSKNIRYSNGGAINLYSYVKVLKDEWGDQLLWIDGGDQFQGTLECMLSDCTIMKDYFNKVGLQGITLGNHDFDYGVEYLRDFISNQISPLIVANVKFNNGTYLYEAWGNVYPYKIYPFDNNGTIIKIGVIGLATKTTPTQTSTDVSYITFEDYFETTKKWATYLRDEEKVNAVIVLAHFGPKCNEVEKMKLGMWDSSSKQSECESGQEIMDYLKQLKTNKINIDGVVAGHVHDVVHHWISDIPVIESSGADYFNIMYLKFKIDKGNIKIQKTQIEGPVPVCEKLWPDTKNCEYRYEDSSVMEEFYFHNITMKQDQELLDSLKFWHDIIDEKVKNDLSETKDEMHQDGVKETLLTDFITDVGKIVTDSDICFFNLGGIRANWHRGNINEIDLFKMFPFNNTWVRFEMYGYEVYHLFQNLAGSILYPFSGSLQTFSYKNNYYNMKSLLLWDGIEEKFLDPKKVYKICTNDFLANGGSAMYKVRKWYKELRNKKDFGIIRESFKNFLKKIKVITEEKFVDKDHPRITFEN
jgi:2',3'-cyclic-nucleotide 2'-phosphodiesterase (5'-nucleotidase family)